MFGFGKKKPAPATSQPTIAEEAGLPDNWVPAEAPVIRPGVETNGPHQYPSGTLPQLLGLQPDLVDTKYGGGIPSVRLMPVASTAQQNASVAATVKQIIQTTPAAPSATPSTGGAITLTAPPEIVVSGSPGNNIALDWATEPAGYEFQVPIGTVGFDGGVSTSGLSAATLALTSALPSTNPEWALYIGHVLTANFTSLVLPGWTAMVGNDANNAFFYRAIPTNGTVSVAQGLSTVGSHEGAILNFSGLAPTIIQSAIGSDIGVGAITVSLPSNTAAGNFILAVFNGSAPTNSPSPGQFTDTQNLTLTGLSYLADTGDNVGHIGSFQQAVLFSTATNAAEAITVTYPLVNGGSLYIYEISGLNPISVKPRFMPEPPTNFAIGTGRVPLFNGGTGTNLSGTGGPSQVVKQNSPGGAFTVGKVDYPDLLGTGVAARYNSAVTAGNGFPTIRAVFDQAGNTANIALSNLSAGISPSGQVVRVSFFVGVHRAATTSSTLPDIQFTWTDQDSGIAQTVFFKNTPGTGNTTATNFSGTVVMSVAGLSAITYQLGANQTYASLGATSMAYGVHLRAEII